MPLQFSQADKDALNSFRPIVEKIDQLDEKYVLNISEEIFKKQPFFLSTLLGYHLDVSKEELEEIMKIYFLIWEYFRNSKRVQKKKVTQANFEKTSDRLMHMLNYIEGEQDQQVIDDIYNHDFQNLQSKALLACIMHRYISRPVIIEMEGLKKGIILIGIKNFIECFESL